MDDLLQQGITAYKAGKRTEARNIFITLVKQNPESERAWGWMYQTSDNDKERIYCLKQMLRINPKNEKPAQLLNQLIAPPSAPITPPPAQTAPPSVPIAPLPNKEKSPNTATRRCPRCQEIIQTGAPRCQYCGWVVDGKKKERQQKKAGIRTGLMTTIISIIAMIIICGLTYGLMIVAQKNIGPTATPTRTTEENAWYACTLFIENQLKVSRIDSQNYNSEGVILLDNGQYRVDVDYAKLMTTYTCILLDRTGGSWELISLVATRK
jgi:hypothetical protein